MRVPTLDPDQLGAIIVRDVPEEYADPSTGEVRYRGRVVVPGAYQPQESPSMTLLFRMNLLHSAARSFLTGSTGSPDELIWKTRLSGANAAFSTPSAGATKNALIRPLELVERFASATARRIASRDVKSNTSAFLAGTSTDLAISVPKRPKHCKEVSRWAGPGMKLSWLRIG